MPSLSRVLLVAGMLLIPLARSEAEESAKTLRVLTTVFPVDLATREVVKGAANVEVTRLLASGVGCPHNYALTPRDRRKLESADVIVANGLGLEEFLGATSWKNTKRAQVIALGESLTNLIRGSGHHEDHSHKKEHGTKTDHSEPVRHGGDNPHVFASPKQMALMVKYLAVELGKISPTNRDIFQKNADAYAGRLNALQTRFVDVLKSATQKKIITHHAVFDYLARDVGLEVVGVIQEHEGVEPSTAALLKLKRTIKEKGVAAIFTEPQYPSRYGEILAQEAGIPVGAFDPVASGPDNAPPEYYESVMQKNIEAMKKLLVGSNVEKR